MRKRPQSGHRPARSSSGPTGQTEVKFQVSFTLLENKQYRRGRPGNQSHRGRCRSGTAAATLSDTAAVSTSGTASFDKIAVNVTDKPLLKEEERSKHRIRRCGGGVGGGGGFQGTVLFLMSIVTIVWHNILFWLQCLGRTVRLFADAGCGDRGDSVFTLTDSSLCALLPSVNLNESSSLRPARWSAASSPACVGSSAVLRRPSGLSAGS